jgi:hypothetical protein
MSPEISSPNLGEFTKRFEGFFHVKGGVSIVGHFLNISFLDILIGAEVTLDF